MPGFTRPYSAATPPPKRRLTHRTGRKGARPHRLPCGNSRSDRCSARLFSPRGRSGNHRWPLGRLTAAQKVAHPPVACRPTLATAGDTHMRLPPAHLTRAPPPRHGPTKARREEVQAAIESLPASSRPLKRSRTRPSLAAPVPAVAGDGITNLVLSSVFLPLAPVGRPPRAGGKRRAEPSVTSWRAHVPPKGLATHKLITHTVRVRGLGFGGGRVGLDPSLRWLEKTSPQELAQKTPEKKKFVSTPPPKLTDHTHTPERLHSHPFP